ncbi:MAG TPA: hypothetical protein VKT77_01960 [Chthonomonadaceae bacterium]|nr:hypothetical protein [Chthonomonadaceae bacterium]
MKRCGITFETLADFHDGRADAESAARVREHVDAGCTQCRETLAWIERAGGTMRDAARHPVPERLLDRMHAVYAERFRQPARRSLMAWLTFDGRATQMPAGARGTPGPAIQLNYSTEEHDVEIWEEPTAEGRWYVIGQVLPREGEGTLTPSEVSLTDRDGVTRLVAPAMPEVHLPSVAAGPYTMVFKLADANIVISDLVVGGGE